MIEAALFIATLALIVFGIERNHRRQPEPRPRFSGSVGADERDRDVMRVLADLTAVRDECQR